MRIVSAFFAMAALAMPTDTNAADGRPLANGWLLYENKEDCSVANGYDNGSLFLLHFDAARNNANISIMNKAFKSIEDGKVYKLRLTVSKPRGGYDEGWGEVEAKGHANDDLKAFSFDLNGRQFLDDFRLATGLGFWRGDILVTSLSMSGSAEAARELEACTRKVQKKNPIDPFED